LRFCCSETDQFGAGVGEGGGDEYAAEAVEAVKEGLPRRIPVSCTNVASVVSWDAATVDNDAEDDEAGTGNDLDDADDKFDLFRSAHCSYREAYEGIYLAISLDTEELNNNQ
jgi:hypothetical protein